LGFARRAAEIADNDEYEMDRIRAKCLLGTVLSATAQPGTPQRDEMLREAEDLLKHARALCVRIRFIELEVEVDLAYARWFAACGHLDEARESGAEALALARKCEYRLKQAEIHLALAEFAEAASDHLEARAHLDKANEAAACDGGPARHQRVIERASELDSGRSGAARFAG
jgi:hypothetical protein